VTLTTVRIEMASTDRLLLLADEGPFHPLRIAVGFFLLPLWLFTTGPDPAGWTLLPFFLLVLGVIRLLPRILRPVLPVSQDVRELWAARREWGKKYDSYQWRKLFAVGIGLAIYVTAVRDNRPASAILTLVCLCAGSLGLIAWRRVRTEQR
jgi:hypothetical protein